MKTKYGHKVIAYYEKYLDGEQFEVIVVDEDTLCSDGEKYYNVHILSERYQQDELNTLKLQVPHSCVTNISAEFDTKYLISRLMEHFIWDRFYNEGIISSTTTIQEIGEH